MTRIRDLHAEWMKDPAYRREYDALEEEFTSASSLIQARTDTGPAPEQRAERVGTGTRRSARA